jgi:hypothetical protein
MVGPPFPPGSRITLNVGRTAVVTTVNLEDPYRPTAKFMTPDGLALTTDSINLAKFPDLQVTSVGGTPVGDCLPKPTARPTTPAPPKPLAGAA